MAYGYTQYLGTVQVGTTLSTGRSGGFYKTAAHGEEVTYARVLDGSYWWANFYYDGVSAWCREDMLVGRYEQWVSLVQKSLITSVEWNGYFGANVKVNISTKTAGVSNSVRYVIYNKKSLTHANVGNVHSWVIPLQWCKFIPDATSVQLGIELMSYEGNNLIGTDTKLLTAKVPLTAVPTISSVVTSAVSDVVPSAWNMYLTNLSKCKVVCNASGAYGSTIKEIKAEINEQVLIGATVTSGILKTSGINTVKVSVKDSRGRISVNSSNIDITNYVLPYMKNEKLIRCNNAGAYSPNGLYGKLTANTYITEITGKTEKTVKVDVKQNGVYGGNFNFGGVLIFGGDLSAIESYSVRLTIGDGLKSSVYYLTLSSGQYTMHIRKNGKGVAFGTACEKDYDFELGSNWNIGTGLKAKIKGLACIRQTNTWGTAEVENGEYVQIYNAGANVWEWINPPMLNGVEYRLAKREGGQAVYAKYIEFGNLPNNTEFTKTLNISGTIIFDKYVWGAYSRIPTFNTAWQIDLYRHGKTVKVKTYRDASAYTWNGYFEYVR